ncbi:ABC transporter ATP-binding protein [Phyllobacterium sp. SB3]|uniref:ABC transporter ATP-binding protein n=1 Tax=Phyllobacterium sp. SB3 TaxID=3156073 RepID=UPI0032AE9409
MTHIQLDAKAVSYQTGAHVLVNAASISVRCGARLAIIGPNGAGKSTLLRMLAGLQRQTSGEIIFNGKNIIQMTPLERARQFAFVGQTDSPDQQLLVEDYVSLGRIPHLGLLTKAADREIVEDSMQRARITHFRRRPLGSLSGGERQRMQLARALSQQPAILFLDEPTNHLDPKARSELLSLVAGLNVTTIAVLHDLPLVAPFATHVAVMHSTQLVASGTPDETLTPRIVSDVFDLDVLRLRHPSRQRDLMVFEAPEQNHDTHPHPRSI